MKSYECDTSKFNVFVSKYLSSAFEEAFIERIGGSENIIYSNKKSDFQIVVKSNSKIRECGKFFFDEKVKINLIGNNKKIEQDLEKLTKNNNSIGESENMERWKE